MFKKTIHISILLAVILIALPIQGASASDSLDMSLLKTHADSSISIPDYVRIERMWRHSQNLYQRLGGRLSRLEKLQNKVQTVIDNAKEKGWDTTSLQAALDAFTAALPEARATYSVGAGIVASHNGFNENGQVTQPTEALDTLKNLREVLKNTQVGLKGTEESLREAVKAFREAHPRN